MGCRVGELVGAGYIAHSEDVGEAGGEILVGIQRAVVAHCEAQRFDAIALGVGYPAEGDQHAVKLDFYRMVAVLRAAENGRRAIAQFKALGLVVQAQIDACAAQTDHHQFAGVGVFTGQQAVAALNLDDLRAELLEGQCQLAADRAAAEHQQPARLLAQVPDGVRGDHRYGIQPRQIGHEGAGAGRDDDIARTDAAPVHLNVPG